MEPLRTPETSGVGTPGDQQQQQTQQHMPPAQQLTPEAIDEMLLGVS